MQTIADDLIDAVQDRKEMDLVEDFALRLPAMVLADLLGMRHDDYRRFQPWVHTIALYFAIGSLGNPETIGALRQTVQQLADYMRNIVEEHRRNPQDDLISSLLAFDQQGETLSETEILSQCMLLLHGGYESTMNTISSGMFHILSRPEQHRWLMDNPARASLAVEEALRYEPAFQFVVRVATTDLEIGNQVIRGGQQVFCVLGAANRDPEAFVDPDQFDLQRQPNPHVGFGYGPHFCIGAILARMEAEIAFKSLLRRMHDLKLVSNVPAWRPAFGVRSLEKLPVTFSSVGPR